MFRIATALALAVACCQFKESKPENRDASATSVVADIYQDKDGYILDASSCCQCVFALQSSDYCLDALAALSVQPVHTCTKTEDLRLERASLALRAAVFLAALCDAQDSCAKIADESTFDKNATVKVSTRQLFDISSALDGVLL